MSIVFAVLNNDIMDAGNKVLRESSASRYKAAERNDWKTLDMHGKCERFILLRDITAQQMSALRKGNIPQEMEDKWFWFMEGDTLYAHRSWTGICIYRIDFKADGNHAVTVNRDPEQYSCTSIDEDRQTLNELLDWWTQSHYDYYNEWLSETVNAIEKSETVFDKLTINGQKVDAVFFHKPNEPYGFLSNWSPSPFDFDGLHFTSTEQYIMYRKCMLFGDEASASAVLATDDVAQQQAIGKKAAGYNDHIWAGMRQMVAYRGLMAKFSQNEDLKRKLLATGDAFLIECAGSDKVWACGVRLNDEKRFDASNWERDNILGCALMEVREKLKQEK